MTNEEETIASKEYLEKVEDNIIELMEKGQSKDTAIQMVILTELTALYVTTLELKEKINELNKTVVPYRRLG